MAISSDGAGAGVGNEVGWNCGVERGCLVVFALVGVVEEEDGVVIMAVAVVPIIVDDDVDELRFEDSISSS